MSSFYCEHIPQVGGVAELDENESHHLVASRRYKIGDSVGLIDGHGVTARGVIQAAAKRTANVCIQERDTHEPMRPDVCIASALPKGDRQRTMFDILGQLGATSFIPLLCERSVSPSPPKANTIRRWEKTLREACKQSANPYFPVIHPALTTIDLFKNMSGDRRYLVADPHAENIRAMELFGSLTVCIGPEGGFSPAELDGLDRSGARRVSLNQNILRIETACAAVLSYIRVSTNRH